MSHLNTKIIPFANLQVWKKRNQKKIVLAGGCFDIFHFGHFTYLREAKKTGELLVVVLESDQSIHKHKKRTSIHTQLQRAQMLSHLDFIDGVVLLPTLDGYEDYLNLVRTVKPAVIAVTEGDSRMFEKQKQALEVGAELAVVCSLTDTISTTSIIEYASIFSN